MNPSTNQNSALSCTCTKDACHVVQETFARAVNNGTAIDRVRFMGKGRTESGRERGERKRGETEKERVRESTLEGLYSQEKNA